ncbi:MAG: 4Fe-4S dicluster domain-containing protein, partial [Syntrophales bacterium LBB04]|nr:4Fe-4S dicluster domain-containing protein [Syntrophales bacterium LBB04]
CIGCKACHPYCTVGAISLIEWGGKKKSEVNQSDCVECGACLRSRVCPKDAIVMPELEWPRKLRSHFSNPYAGHLPAKKGAPPAAEPKLNEMTGRISEGMTAFVVEVGRPSVSASLRDVQKICMALAREGVAFDPGSGVTALMEDPATGKFSDDILDEKGLNITIYFSTANKDLPTVLRALKEVSSQIETVFSIGLSNRLNDSAVLPTALIAEEAGFTIQPHAKTVVGLGRSRKEGSRS